MSDFLDFERVDIQFGYDEGDLWFVCFRFEVSTSWARLVP